MTEKFMKLSDFLKLIKKEDEQGNPVGTDGSQMGNSPADIETVHGPDAVHDDNSTPDKEIGRFDFSKALSVFEYDRERGKTNTSPDGKPPSAPAPQESGPEPAVNHKKEVTDAELASILSYFGWKITGAVPNIPKTTAKAPDTSSPAGRDSGKSGIKNEKDENQVPKKSDQIFDGLDSAVIKEIFTQEELEQLRREETHVFTDSDIKTLSGIQKSGLKQGRKASAEDIKNDNNNEGEYSPVSRRRYYRTGCFGGILYFGFIVCLSVLFCALSWMAANDVLSLNKAPVTADIYVGEAKDIKQVATELQTKGIIEYKWLFEIFASYSQEGKNIDPGTYTVSNQLDYRAIIIKLQQSSGWSGEERMTATVLIPEGKTLTQIFQILSDAGVCAYETLLDCSQNYAFDYDFLSVRNTEDDSVQYKLEGYLFPDTYEFYLESEPEEAIGKLLANYKAKVTDDMAAQAQSMGYSMNEIITIASLIEKEAGSDEERSTIASVIYNRLNSNYYPYLQIDATVQYALGEHKEQLSYEDRMVDSKYNTYMQEGLPPGPIASPGLASIRAALDPASTGYYFYALNKEGTA
jgi:conserved hypothetical protein, YceG family